MIPNDFISRTREQRQEFENIKNNAFVPTEEEKAKQFVEQEKAKQQLILDRVSARGITIPAPVTKERMLAVMNWLWAQQFLGEDLEWYIEKQLELLWTLENVMDNLVLTYL